MRSYLARFDTPEFRSRIEAQSDDDPAHIKLLLDTYFAEMLYGYEFATRHMPDRKLRIMEVGAGLGLISAYLASLGHEVVALEPANLAFGIFDITKKTIWEELGDEAPYLEERPAEDIDIDETGDFDFIFSINVLEHIGDLEAATAAMLKVLRPGAISAHLCPNYFVPYEPHYSLTMVPGGFHNLTRRLFAGTIDPNPDAWNSLNFITAARVRKMARANNVDVTFQKGLIHETFLRMGAEEEISRRHGNTIVGRAYRMLKATGLLSLTRHIPATMTSPMAFIYERPAK